MGNALRYEKNIPEMESAVQKMVMMLLDRKSHSEILAEWDKNRKNYWFYDIKSEKEFDAEEKQA